MGEEMIDEPKRELPTPEQVLRSMEAMTRLVRALDSLVAMRHPSAHKLLQKHGYLYEAGIVNEVMDAWIAHKEAGR